MGPDDKDPRDVRRALRRCRRAWLMGATSRHEYLEQTIGVLRSAGRLKVLSRYHRGLLDGKATRWDARRDEAGGKRVERWRYEVHVLA